jgi:hypothetical protein
LLSARIGCHWGIILKAIFSIIPAWTVHIAMHAASIIDIYRVSLVATPYSTMFERRSKQFNGRRVGQWSRRGLLPEQNTYTVISLF